MIAKKLNNAELEAVYDLLSEAVDAVPEEQRLLFLAKLALVLSNMVGSPGQVALALKAAAANLGTTNLGTTNLGTTNLGTAQAAS